MGEEQVQGRRHPGPHRAADDKFGDGYLPAGAIGQLDALPSIEKVLFTAKGTTPSQPVTLSDSLARHRQSGLTAFVLLCRREEFG